MMTKCWNCKNSTGHCPWSKELKPVEGWTTIPTQIYNSTKNSEQYYYPSYIVIDCPMFKKDKLTIKDICELLKINIRTYYRYKSKNILKNKLKELNITEFDIFKQKYEEEYEN